MATVEDPFGLTGNTLGEYAIEHAVATGGFGVVYKARHQSLQRHAAIKVLKIPSSVPVERHEEFVQKFLAEAQAIASLKHPAIVGVLDFKTSTTPSGEQVAWMALEWIEGETLTKNLARRRGAGGRSPSECLQLMAPVFDALAEAHAHGIAHRDIKPSNIMLPLPDAPGRSRSRFSAELRTIARVLDFGIAKVMSPDEEVGTGDTETETTLRAYSLSYAAPEQVSSTRTGPWTDVHALALLVTELLIDAPPYPSQDRTELYSVICAPTRPTPWLRGFDVGAWEPVLLRALSLRPHERFADAGEFLTALEESLPRAAHRPYTPAPSLPPHTEPVPGFVALAQPLSTTVPFTAHTAPVRRRKLTTRTLVLGLLIISLAAAVGGTIRHSKTREPPRLASSARSLVSFQPSGIELPHTIPLLPPSQQPPTTVASSPPTTPTLTAPTPAPQATSPLNSPPRTAPRPSVRPQETAMNNAEAQAPSRVRGPTATAPSGTTPARALPVSPSAAPIATPYDDEPPAEPSPATPPRIRPR